MKTLVHSPKSKVQSRRSVLGRTCLVADHKHTDRAIFGATVIDCMAGENDRAKRVRLQTGEHAGEVLMRGEYDILEFTD